MLQLGYRPPHAAPNLRQYLLNPGDRLVLCTDGLWRLSSDHQFVMAASLSPQAACELLCNRSDDDQEEASVVVVAFSEAPRYAKPGQCASNG